MMLEEICQREDELEIKNLEYSLQFTKAGDDMEKPAIVNYLKKEKLMKKNMTFNFLIYCDFKI